MSEILIDVPEGHEVLFGPGMVLKGFYYDDLVSSYRCLGCGYTISALAVGIIRDFELGSARKKLLAGKT